MQNNPEKQLGYYSLIPDVRSIFSKQILCLIALMTIFVSHRRNNPNSKMIVLSKLFSAMLINRYFNIKQNCHRTSFHIFLSCYVEISVFGGLWWSAVDMGLFRMINFVENGLFKMCGTILSH